VSISASISAETNIDIAYRYIHGEDDVEGEKINPLANADQKSAHEIPAPTIAPQRNKESHGAV
jgi:hypothetical protein